MSRLFSALAFAVAFAGLSQAASAPKPAVPQKSSADAVIERRIQAKFAKSKINVEHFTVAVHSGVATIEGKTNVIQHKGVATRLAKTGGALAVQNRIQISDEAKAKAVARLQKTQAGSNTGPLAHAAVVQPGSK